MLWFNTVAGGKVLAFEDCRDLSPGKSDAGLHRQ